MWNESWQVGRYLPTLPTYLFVTFCMRTQTIHSVHTVSPDADSLWTLAPGREVEDDDGSWSWTTEGICGPCGTSVRIHLERDNMSSILLWEMVFIEFDRFVGD